MSPVHPQLVIVIKVVCYQIMSYLIDLLCLLILFTLEKGVSLGLELTSLTKTVVHLTPSRV